MNFTREQVLKIVDTCFHMYASDFRIDAKDEANEVMNGIKSEEGNLSINSDVIAIQISNEFYLSSFEEINESGSYSYSIEKNLVNAKLFDLTKDRIIVDKIFDFWEINKKGIEIKIVEIKHN